MSRKLSDRNADLGGSRKGSVFPEDVKVRDFSSVGGAGEIMDYPDTIDKIDRDQREGVKKAEGRKMKAGYRN